MQLGRKDDLSQVGRGCSSCGGRGRSFSLLPTSLM